MKAFALSISLLIAQMISHQERQIFHLSPYQKVIPSVSGGKLLEIVNGPSDLALPSVPPKVDAQGLPWSIEIKNLGPGPVVISGKSNFKMTVQVGQTINVLSDGSRYSLFR